MLCVRRSAFPSAIALLPSGSRSSTSAPSLASTTPGIFASLIVQPVAISNVQVFAIGGVGIWAEGFGDGKRTGVLNAGNVVGGVLVPLAGPLRLRLDYRFFLLGEVAKEEVGAIAPSRKHPQRIPAGLYFKF